jgi:hypothetical protein
LKKWEKVVWTESSIRHIDIRYFFIKDRLGIENIDVNYCPTEQMLALFRKFREVFMGHKHILDTLKEITPTPSQERVGKDNVQTTLWFGDGHAA